MSIFFTTSQSCSSILDSIEWIASIFSALLPVFSTAQNTYKRSSQDQLQSGYGDISMKDVSGVLCG